MSQQRLIIASHRKELDQTEVLTDTLPPLEDGEIRISVDKVGLSANNRFYAQAGDMPMLKFFSVYPLSDKPDLAVVPAWGTGTVVESENEDFKVGRQFRGFFAMADYVQMKAKLNPKEGAGGFVACGGLRDKCNPAYNVYADVKGPFAGEGERADLAMVSGPGSAGFFLYHLLQDTDFYHGDGVFLTSASSKFSLFTAHMLRSDRKSGRLKRLVGFTSARNVEFVESTGLYDGVYSYDDVQGMIIGNEELNKGQTWGPEETWSDKVQKNVYVDVAGIDQLWTQLSPVCVKGLVVGQTQPESKPAALGVSALCKVLFSLVCCRCCALCCDKLCDPHLDMFFAPTVVEGLLKRWGCAKMEQMCDEAVGAFVDEAMSRQWIKVTRSDQSVKDVQAAYTRAFRGGEALPPSEAIVVSVAGLGGTAAAAEIGGGAESGENNNRI